MKNTLNKTKKYIIGHKVVSTIVIVIAIILIYYISKSIFGTATTTQYVSEVVKRGTIMETVTGSGQVSSENQLDITSEVSGKVTSIKVKVGQKVKAGELIATIDSADAYIDLETARIAYAKLTEPAKIGDKVNAENTLSKSYSDGFSSISDAFVEIAIVIDGLDDLFYSRDGYLSDQISTNLNDTAESYRTIAAISYDKADNQYEALLNEYKNLSRTSATSSIETMLMKTYDLTKAISGVLKNTQSTIVYISTSQAEYNSAVAPTATVNVNTWSADINSQLTSLLSTKNSIESNKDTLDDLLNGADDLDIKSERLSLQQKERAYAKYFIRALFDGVVGRIPVNVYDQAGSGTVIATISGNQKITNIPLNEVDAVKVVNDQRVELTFDAIPNLKINGKVIQVDLVGTASQGVVTYNIKIAFEDTDARIRTGMSNDVTIITKEIKDIIVVPTTAIKTRKVGGQQTNYVEILGTDGQPIQKNVILGDSDDTNTEIKEGINEGDKIIIKTINGIATTGKSQTPTIFSSLGGSQNNVIRNANRTTGTR